MPILDVRNVAKRFTLHAQGGTAITAIEHVSFTVDAGEAVALTGASGSGKSSLMRMIYGNYACEHGEILIKTATGAIDIAKANPRQIAALRRATIGHVSQFLRVIPRVSTLDLVAEPMLLRGVDANSAIERAQAMLTRLAIPQALWSLSPVTFSGGEQQRVNIARSMSVPYPLLLVDEPTASLDAQNRQTVIDLLQEARCAGTALVGIFHDTQTRDAVCTHTLDLSRSTSVAGAAFSGTEQPLAV